MQSWLSSGNDRAPEARAIHTAAGTAHIKELKRREENR